MTMLENPMVLCEMDGPDEELTCPRCGKVWDRVGDTWEADGAIATDKRPVDGKRCRFCAGCDAMDDADALISFAHANKIEAKALQYAMVRGDSDAINAWIWEDVATVISDVKPELLATCISEYIEDKGLMDDLIDHEMGGWA